MRRLRKFLALSPADQALILRCLGLLAVVRLGLNTLRVERVIEELNRWIKPRAGASLEEHELGRIAWAVKAASACVPGATCLTQALTLQSILRSHGCLTELKFGVRRKPDGQFHAHAWVVFRGRVVIGDDSLLPEYTAMTSFG